ncbi:MAG: sugar nucleotide-binding protein [Methylomarinum sp.]|nr:sugar nucleotide-binding protein [Methylomarinum sp.]
MRILILGITGMLGSAIYRELCKEKKHDVWGTLRSERGLRYFSTEHHDKLLCNIDVLDHDNLINVFETVRPEVVINCVGLIKQLADSKSPLTALPINAMLPHRLANISSLMGARLIHISTDCVFSGTKGMYVESDTSDAEDLYGKSKYIGEVIDRSHAITLRTSIIGHELNSQASLVDWFLSQGRVVEGYKKAIFSGLPTVELASVINNHILPAPNLSGLYHVSVEAIDKYSLLKLIADIYQKNIEITRDEQVCINRSLDSTKFQRDTGYKVPEWGYLINKMYESQKGG